MHHILIVDDEPAVLAALRRALRLRFGARLVVQTEADALLALDHLRRQHFDVIVSDLRMPVMDGLSFLCLAAGLQPHSVRMVLTGSADFDTAQRAINESGVFRYLTKPWDDTLLAAHIEAALVQAAAARALDTRTPQERELQRLETLEPGITRVDWGPGGEVLLEPAGATTAACPSRSRT
jgi:two-component system, probable response regulator PhcQ